MLRLSANLSTLFTERPLLERPAAAAGAGFAAVELQFPYDVPASQLAAACRAAAVQVVLINLPAGDRDAGELGLAGLPGREAEFRAAVEQGAEYAGALGCRQVNSLAGRCLDPTLQTACWQTLIDNTRTAAARLSARGMRLLTEVLNPVDVPGFLLTRSTEGDRLLAEVDHPNLGLQFDLYHRVAAGEDWQAQLQARLARIGHIQISDYPGRHEPGTGRLDWPRIFDVLGELDYPGHVGCEYFPIGTTEESFGWRRLVGAAGGRGA
jgi:hydroxypyruvate isomerase